MNQPMSGMRAAYIEGYRLQCRLPLPHLVWTNREPALMPGPLRHCLNRAALERGPTGAHCVCSDRFATTKMVVMMVIQGVHIVLEWQCIRHVV